jgi:two-component system, OmpR family, phosphate regulon response regulator PhoB
MVKSFDTNLATLTNNAMSNPRILLVEDDRALSEIVSYNLEQHGYPITVAYDGQAGFNAAIHQPPDIVLLDVMLPTIDGIEVCRRLRSHPATNHCVIVMMTAKSEEADQLLGFSVGADDYVVKPFSVRVLLERVKAWRRRLHSEPEENTMLAAHGVVVDRVKHVVTLNNEPMNLTPSEFRLLETLMREPGRAYERKDLIDLALGEDTVVLDRTIDVHIRSLRKKLGEQGQLIETVRGVGYRFQDEN